MIGPSANALAPERRASDKRYLNAHHRGGAQAADTSPIAASMISTAVAA